MTATTKRAAMLERIERHGRQLLAIFGAGMEPDWTPVELCKRLRRIEVKAHRLAEQWYNGEISEAAWIAKSDDCLTDVVGILCPTFEEMKSFFVNGDPRGYALKIESEYAKNLDIHKDWGGYGIIAPDLSEDS